jgi:cyclophilin family peptidyl-prolyl cis-trans isomerase
MIQGGDPLGTGTGGESIWGGEFADEFSADLSNRRGSIAMANRGPATNTSQFFINQADNNFLDSKHTVFGQVVAGMRVVDEIANVEKGAMDKPSEDVTMELAVYEVVENAVE